MDDQRKGNTDRSGYTQSVHSVHTAVQLLITWFIEQVPSSYRANDESITKDTKTGQIDTAIDDELSNSDKDG